MSLRRVFLVFATVLGLMGVIGGGGLISFTTALHRTSAELGNAVESVRAAEELQIELLSHRATRDGLMPAATEGRLRQRLPEWFDDRGRLAGHGAGDRPGPDGRVERAAVVNCGPRCASRADLVQPDVPR